MVKEEDTLIITINGLFNPVSGSCADKFEHELLQPSPSFVSLSPIFRHEFTNSDNGITFENQLVLLIISPKRGDAGKYNVKVSEELCPGSVGVLEFRIKVKKRN